MPLILPRCDDSLTELQSKHPSLMKAKLQIFNKLLYEYQQKENTKLMQALKSVPSKYHKFPFHHWIHQNTPINSLTDKALELLWHQRLLHLSPSTLKDANKHIIGVPDLSKFEFNDIDNCSVCSRAKLTKVSPGYQSLTERVTNPFQGLFIDYGFPGRVSCDK